MYNDSLLLLQGIIRYYKLYMNIGHAQLYIINYKL